jgi:Sulfotransferase domain
MLQVIGAGLPRTGTTSMKAALERLGFGPCYHMFEILTHPEQVERWLPVGSGGPVDWERVFAGYRATQDWPASGFWRELAEAYPQAKVVLTVRDPRRWYASFHTLLSQAPDTSRPEHAPAAARAVMTAMARLRPTLERIGRAAFGSDWSLDEGPPGEERAIAAYHRHVETVRESLPAERLLVFDVRQGWDPLCAFLGVDVPAGEPFPHLNDSTMLQSTFEQMLTTGQVASPFDTDR